MSIKALALAGRDFCPRESRRKQLPTANADLENQGAVNPSVKILCSCISVVVSTFVAPPACQSLEHEGNS